MYVYTFQNIDGLTFIPYRTPEHGLYFRCYAVEFGVSGAVAIWETLKRKSR